MPKLRSVCAVPVLVFWVSLLGSAQEPPLQVTQGLHREVYDYLTAIARADWTQRDARIAAIHTPAEVEQRQAFIRSKIKRGFLVIAFDPPGQGERIQYYDPNWAARE